MMIIRYSFLFLIISPVWAQQPPAISVEVAAVQQGTVVVEVTTVGNLRARESVIIRPEVAGRILKLHFTEGQQVSQGDVLVTLDPAEYQALLAESEADVKINKLSYDRAKDLLQKSVASRQAYDEAQATLAQSEARYALDQVRLQKMTLTAPFSGTLGLRNISEGAYIQAGTDIITLVDSRLIKVDFRIPEKFASQVEKTQAITLHIDAYPQETFTGQVYAIDPVMDEETRTVLLRAQIDNAEQKLSPGMFAQVKLVLEKRYRALLIPEQAIIPKGQDSFVFKVVDNIVHLVQVQLGQRQVGTVEIQKGLSHQDQVVVGGQMKLKDGMAVTVTAPAS